jgi:maltooligosyltrehalose trehalohydrolase
VPRRRLQPLGPAGNYLAAYSPSYFAKTESPWGQSLDWSNRVARDLVISNAMYWLDDMRFDALRLDAIHWIDDRREPPILEELAARVAELAPKRLLIAEDERNDPRAVATWGLDATWADDFHHQVRVLLTGERAGYYGAYARDVSALARIIERGWLYEGQMYAPFGRPRGQSPLALPLESLVFCIENHDQVGNRAAGDRLSETTGVDAFAAAALLLSMLPATPLVFMGQEWCASTPFQYFTDHDAELGRAITEGRRRELSFARGVPVPDPQSRETFERSKLDWRELAQGDHARILELHTSALRLRRTLPALRDPARASVKARAEGQILVVTRSAREGDVVVVASFASEPTPLGDLVPRGMRVLLGSRPQASEGEIPPRTTLVLGDERAARHARQ